MSRPLLLGHRGSPRQHRENTLRSFQAALDGGLDGVEFDVRRLADGTLVVHHDERLFDGWRLADLTRGQLAPHPVPTLEEVLAWAADTGAYLNVELKYESWWPDDRAARTAKLLRRYGLLPSAVVSSFNPLVLAALRQAAPEVERGLLFDRAPDVMPHVAARLGVSALHPRWHLVTPALVETARTRGWRVNVWTVNDPEFARHLLQLGVDGLIGDDPGVLLTSREADVMLRAQKSI
ncbi:glycerophosphodiester phosphodiesterase (plasmid) [Deinococcus metallilatus]|uniref:Glycerophosphoryl diester phosphodiesterase n=1 Tax=Deinococcus metallilatus TaxID=1211322 RepID=A0ABR6MNP2_9DEIO|nr:glycerophosphodiester phosphodiesterase [Deinococcus metallilatus]MBB5293557.1 glycerophosphoryl diester phosphodiesterase [Deinococcus metallilatus]QBY06628.1 glycerophosphodiester phosphodiesterase [Deinococcus metallilatus]RXJ17971.1 glycerophosphodiester phosphodiesterase [Deinococcus metallilatus]GMA15223.1 glycerophosphoryl diester phosphodiesterase [Deinococcus metallilatus]